MENLILMHKNIPVMEMEYDTETKTIIKIRQIFHIDHIPYGSFNSRSGIISRAHLNEWYRGRGIPHYRRGLSQLCNVLGIADPLELLDKSYALSLSDTYWFKNENSSITWEDINFFSNDFSEEAFIEASFSDEQKLILSNDSLSTPNNTTDGYHAKAWTKRNNKPYLLKSGSTFQQEPINEWFVSEIAEKMDFHAVQYSLEKRYNKIICGCYAFTSENAEMISANDIFSHYKKPNGISHMNYFIQICEEHGLTQAAKHLEDMFLIDYLVLNTDRHLRNFGILRNPETLKWIDIVPIFDTGTSLSCLEIDANIINGANHAKAKFFDNTNKKFNKLLDEVLDLALYDLTALDDLKNSLKAKLSEYQSVSRISDERIEAITQLFSRQLSSAKAKQLQIRKENEIYISKTNHKSETQK